jgi:hypothetical protein
MAEDVSVPVSVVSINRVPLERVNLMVGYLDACQAIYQASNHRRLDQHQRDGAADSTSEPITNLIDSPDTSSRIGPSSAVL